jgi:hypothetical protein
MRAAFEAQIYTPAIPESASLQQNTSVEFSKISATVQDREAAPSPSFARQPRIVLTQRPGDIMDINAEGPLPPAELARDELLRFLSTGFAGSCLSESNEMLRYLETTVASDKPSASVAVCAKMQSGLPSLRFAWKLFAA